MSLTSIETIKKLARQYKIHPSALLGQHFLVDDAVLRSMVEFARVEADDVILEIGPGFGTLTAELIKHAKEVIAVEKDKILGRYLQERFGDRANFTLESGDILKFKPPAAPYRIISNIPYQITGKIIRKFVGEETRKPTDMLIMVQKEVGERVCARAGKMNLLAIWVQLYGQPAIVRPVSRQSFWPIPKVDSVLLSIAGIKSSPLYPIRDFIKFWRVLRLGFSSPRKQLHNNLVSGLRISQATASAAISNAGLDAAVRAQELSIKDWLKVLSELE